MTDVQLARALFGTTMGFHIIFATLGVGIPLMILVSEWMFQRTKDQDYAIMAKRWTRGFAVLLGVAIPSGTIAGVQLSLLWPGFMAVVGEVIALPFQIEIFAFLLEALFMSIYVYAADRLSAKMRLLSVFLVSVGAAASAILITNVHSFEGTPAGFKIVNGKLTDIDPWAAFFNPGFFVTATHVTFTAFTTGAFVMATIAAIKMLRNAKESQEYAFHRKALMMALVVGGIFSTLTAVNGHETAQMLHHYQPEKLAAAEGLFETRSHAPLVVGGYTDPTTHQIKYGIEIPWMLSFLAGNSFDEVVVGLNDFKKEDWPPLFVHTLFNGMVIIGTALIGLAFAGLVWRKMMKKDEFPRWFMWLLVASGPMAMLSIEMGWIFACSGRQPWVIYHVMRTADATTTSGNLGTLFLLFGGAYLFFGIVTALVLYYYFKKHPLIQDLGVTA